MTATLVLKLNIGSVSVKKGIFSFAKKEIDITLRRSCNLNSLRRYDLRFDYFFFHAQIPLSQKYIHVWSSDLSFLTYYVVRDVNLGKRIAIISLVVFEVYTAAIIRDFI